MTTKTERFEMRLDADVLERIDRWRSEQDDHPSRAEAVRRLVESGLATTSRDSVDLSDGEKLLAIMLQDIYSHLKIKNGEINPDFVSDAIFGGHYWSLNWELSGLFHGHVDDPRTLRFVCDVLEMWTFIERAYETFSDDEKEWIAKESEPFGEDVRFQGFDGNNESEYMAIAQFLVEKMDRFSEFSGHNFNSHIPTLDLYRRMLDVFEPTGKSLVGQGLTASQVVDLLNAQKFH